MKKQAKNTICLWYDRDAEEAARFYARTFPDSSVGAVHRAPGDFPSGKKGDVLTVEFTVMGIPCLGLNGGPGSSTTGHSRFRSQPLTRPKRIVTGTRSSATAAKRARAAGARTNGACLADYADRFDQSDHRSRSRCRQTRVRRDDEDEKDRHRCNRGGAPRLRLHLGSVHLGSAKGT